MATIPLGQMSAPRAAGPDLLACVRDHGSASHPYTASAQLLSGPEAGRNLADAIHFLCALHGRHPGVIELVAARTVDPPARAWLSEAGEAFAAERAFLARLAVAAGPVPGTPGSGGEAEIAMQRSAIATIAKSERRGCAIGAALAVAADWVAIRNILDTAAALFGIGGTRSWFRDAALDEVANRLGDTLPVRRALLFGAEQVALQHRGLWELLQARAEARAPR